MGQSEAVHRTRHVHIREQDANVSVHPRRTVGVATISPHGQLRVYVSTRPVDFRNDIDGLAMAVQDVLGLDPFGGKRFADRAFRDFAPEPGQEVMPDGLVHGAADQGRTGFEESRRGHGNADPATVGAARRREAGAGAGPASDRLRPVRAPLGCHGSFQEVCSHFEVPGKARGRHHYRGLRGRPHDPRMENPDPNHRPSTSPPDRDTINTAQGVPPTVSTTPDTGSFPGIAKVCNKRRWIFD